MKPRLLRLFDLAGATFKDAWAQRQHQAEARRATLAKERTALAKQIDSLLDRIVEATSQSVIKAYEERIARLERQKAAIDEKLDERRPPVHAFEDLPNSPCSS